MKVYEALKKVKLLAGEIKELHQNIMASATWTEEHIPAPATPTGVTVVAIEPERKAKELFKLMMGKKEELAALKGKLAVANAPIQDKLAALGEMKEVAAMCGTLLQQRPSSDMNTRRAADGNYVTTTVYTKCVFTIEELEKARTEAQQKIQSLEGEINAHNFTATLG